MRFPWSSRLAALGVLLALVVGAGRAEAQSVRGTVRDSADGQPLEGAVVTLVGTNRRAQTSANGQYAFDAVAPGRVALRVQIIGYAPQMKTITVIQGEDATVDFALEVRAVQLEEMVAVGYGTVSRDNLATAVSSVTSEEITGQANASADVALQGRAPGVQVVQNAGNPGNAVSVRVRGTASLSANTQPLYVVDGVPVVSEDLSQLDLGGQGVRAITGLSSDDIASIDVLKDAAAASIYGARGSNGVVLITTKRGQTGRSQVTFNGYYGTQSAAKKIDMLTATEYITYMNEAAENDGYGADYFGPVGVADSINTNWQDEVFRTAPISGAELAVSGGSEAVRYRVAGSWFDQKGIVLSSGYRRLGARANLDFVASPKLSFSTSLAITGERNQRVEADDNLEGIVGNAIAHEPYLPVRMPDGSFTSTADGLQYPNAVALARFNQTHARTSTVLGNVEARYQFTPSLAFTGRVGVDLYTLREDQYQSPLVVGTEGAGLGGIAKRAYATSNRYVFDGFFNWNREFSGGQHQLALTAGSSIELNRADNNFVRGEGLSDPTLKEVSNATKVTSFSGTFQEDNLVSVFGRANYTIQEKYLFGLSFRRDGASVFGPDNRYGFFPGASVAWVASREGFLANNRTLSLLKLRASLGRTGNQAIGPYPWQGTACTGNYGDEAGYYPCTFANPSLSWEKTTQLNLGADLELWNGRVLFSADWYNKKTNDLLLSRPVAGNSGYTSYIDNVGALRNRGFEFSLTTVNAQPSRAEGFRWVTTLNFSHNRNEVTELYNDQPFSTGYYDMNRVQVGHPLGAFHGYQFTGVDPATGDALYKDVDGDGSITTADRTFIGDPWPDFTGGFTSTITWKRFDLTGFFQFSKGGKVFNAMRVFSDEGGYNYDNKFADVMDRWRQPGDRTRSPRPSFDGVSDARRISSRFLEDGSYLRLQDVTLGYQLPAALAASAGFANARFYIRAQNLFTITDYTGYNPEVNSNGSTATASVATDFYTYPVARTWSFGIQAGW
jgi:TonB-linked SusC/RagA family outer membrane protein